MNGRYLLTVIVPVYNLENNIEICLDSILNQNFDDLQILIIDDASTDNTYNILSAYCKNNKNITLYRNLVNKGVSYCRNLGLSLVDTKYIAFLDGDDWIDSNCYSKAIQKLEKDNCIDIALWNIQTVYSRSQCLKRYFYEDDNTISNSYALNIFTRSINSNIYISPLLGNKIIRTNLISKHNIQFHGYFYEDDIFIFKCLLFANQIQLLSGANLYYFQRDDSVMHSFSESNIIEFYEVFPSFRNFLIANNLWNGNENYFYSYYEKCIQNLLILLHNSSFKEHEKRNLLCIIFKQFYEKTDIKDYTKYCDLRLFPL